MWHLRAAGWLCLTFFLCPGVAAATELEVFAGSASKPATVEVARAYEATTGIRVLLHFGGSGVVLSQMELTRRGDVYFPGSSDFMAVARDRGVVDPATEVRVVYLLPAINVAKGNPKGIRGLEDLVRDDVRVGMARPDTVCVGLYGVEILEARGLAERVRPRIVNYSESCTKTAQMLALGLVDAVLGWDVFDHWAPDKIETVPYPPDQVVRIGYIPAAVSTYTKNPEEARAFLAYLVGPEARVVYAAHGYLTTLKEARARARPDTPVGGRFELPEGWR